MTPRQLRYFIQIAQSGSITAAAKALYIAQPSLSLQIAGLEEELGVTLLLRKPRGVELTERGEKLLGHAGAILRHIESAKADVSSDSDNPSGEVTVGMSQSICNLLPLYLIRSMAEQFPGITLDITAGHTSTLRNWLSDGSVDVGIFAEEGPESDEILRQPLLSERLFMVSTIPENELPLQRRQKSPTIRFADLTGFEFVLPSVSRDDLGAFIARIETECGIELHKRPGHGQLMTNMSFVLAGECATILPMPAFGQLAESGVVTAVAISEPDMCREVSINTIRGKPLTAAQEKTIELVRNCTRAAFRDGKWAGELLL